VQSWVVSYMVELMFEFSLHDFSSSDIYNVIFVLEANLISLCKAILCVCVVSFALIEGT